MKKFKIVLTAIVMLFTFSSFATDPVKVTPQIKAAFEKDFAKATVVNWEKTSDFYFASFLLNEQSINAAYSEDGELLATSRRVYLNMIPLSVTLAISERYPEYKVLENATELSFLGVTSYYVNIENENQLLKLKVSSGGHLEIESKLNK